MRGLTWVLEREDDEHQQRAGNEFTEELARLRHKRLRIRAENARRRVWSRWNGAQVVPLEEVDCGDVVRVHDAAPDEAAEDLRNEVDGEPSPGELAEETVAECYCGVEVCA